MVFTPTTCPFQSRLSLNRFLLSKPSPPLIYNYMQVMSNPIKHMESDFRKVSACSRRLKCGSRSDAL